MTADTAALEAGLGLGFTSGGGGGGGSSNPCWGAHWLPNPICFIPIIAFAPPQSAEPRRRASYLLVVDDCYEDNLLGLVRRREYQILDENYKPFGAGGAGAFEIISDVSPATSKITGAGVWGSGIDSGGRSGVFFDFYGNGSNLSTTTANQSYYGSSFTGDVWADILAISGLTVLEPNGSGNIRTYGSYTVQNNTYSDAGVKINDYYRNPFLSGKAGCSKDEHSTGYLGPHPWKI